MRKKLYRYGNRVDKFDTYYFDSQKKLPGPGSYNHNDMVGKSQVSSIMNSTQQFSVPQAQDRFKSPTIIKHNACPGSYTPAASIDQHKLSQHKYVQRTKFGVDNTNVLE